MRRFLSGMMVLALASSSQIARAADQDDEQENNRAAENHRERATRAYLGIGVEPLHPSLIGHLADLLHGGEGVRIVQVAEDSPADDAGLRANDVLLRYDDQRIFTAEQLARLVSRDEPGREVTLGIIRSGKTKKIHVTLGERREAAPPPEHRALRPPVNGREPRRGDRAEKSDQWETFDSLSLSRIGENRFNATIKYRNKDGKLVTHRFQGTREEIRRDIEEETDLPANERGHLLRALGLRHHAVQLDMPQLWVLPDGRVILEMPESEATEAEDSDGESAL